MKTKERSEEIKFMLSKKQRSNILNLMNLIEQIVCGVLFLILTNYSSCSNQEAG